MTRQPRYCKNYSPTSRWRARSRYTERMHKTVRDMSVSYERFGEAGSPKVLIVHGWGDSAAGWHSMARRLSARYDVLVPDLPGFGSTNRPATAWDLNDYADFINAFCKIMRFRPNVLIAHSFGGAVAVRGVADGTLTPNRLVLLDSAGLRSGYHGHSRPIRLITRIGKVCSYVLPGSLRKRLRHGVYRSLGPDVLVGEDLQETYKRVTTDDIQASAARLNVPVLLIYGSDDEATPPQYGRILHNLIDGSSLEVVAAAGHFVHLDKPDIVFKLVTDFIDR